MSNINTFPPGASSTVIQMFDHKVAVFHKLQPTDLALHEPLTYLQLVFAETGETISAGNFHGEYPAKVKSH